MGCRSWSLEVRPAGRIPCPSVPVAEPVFFLSAAKTCVALSLVLVFVLVHSAVKPGLAPSLDLVLPAAKPGLAFVLPAAKPGLAFVLPAAKPGLAFVLPAAKPGLAFVLPAAKPGLEADSPVVR